MVGEGAGDGDGCAVGSGGGMSSGTEEFVFGFGRSNTARMAVIAPPKRRGIARKRLK